jgi:dTMP kinase
VPEHRGRFIVLEGGDGAGKSSVQRALGDRIAATGRECVLTREPGGTKLGEAVRALVLEGDSVAPLAELLLFEAARAQLVAEVIRPALERRAIVLCDRFAASSVAYQGFGRQLGREAVERANAVATAGLAPDLTLLLDAPVTLALERRAGAGNANRLDAEDAAFHERVRQGFLALARESEGSWRVIDATRPLDSVIDDAWIVVQQLI